MNKKIKHMKKILFALLACATLLTACEPKEILVTKITLHKYEGSLVEGDSRLIKAIVSPEAATRPEITWTSSDTGVARVEPGATKNGVAQGTIVAVAQGTATITLSATDGSGVTAAYALTVTEKSILVTRIQLTKESAKLNVGQTFQLEAVVTPDNATYPEVLWASSKPDVATVDATGKVTAVKAGTTEITATATDDGKVKCDKPCTVTVREPVTQPMFVKFTDMKIRVGAVFNESVWYGTVDNYGDREDVDLDDLTNCKSSNESVATVFVGKYKDTQGKETEGVWISGVTPGSAVLTIADQDGNSVQVPVEVIPAADVPENYNYGMELFETRKLDNWGAHGEVTLGPGYVDGTQCVWVKTFGRNDSNGNPKSAYTLFTYTHPKGGVDITAISNPALYIRFYINDPSLVILNGSFSQIELCSGGDMDDEEVTFVAGGMFTNWEGHSAEAHMELKSGWNNIVLPLDYAQARNALFRPKRVNYLRFYQNPGENTPGCPNDLTGKGLEIAVDQVRIVDWTEFDTCDNFDTWYDGGTANNRPCYRFEESFDGHTGVFTAQDDLLTGPISNFRLKEWPGRVYAMPVNMWSGDKDHPGNAQLSFWLWIDDPDFYNKCTLTIELSSENINDAHNWEWSYLLWEQPLTAGWNKITGDFAQANHEGSSEADQTYSDRKINYFRIVFTPDTNNPPRVDRYHTYKIDDLRITKK